jgi:hypothetical protein
MRRVRTILVLTLTVSLLGLLISRMSGPRGFATPSECVDHYCESHKDGNAELYLSCLAEPLRSEGQQGFASADALSQFLKDRAKDVTSFVRLGEPVVEGASASVEVDENRRTGVRRFRVHLERFGRDWLIVRIDPPQEVPMPIPYETHVRDVPE